MRIPKGVERWLKQGAVVVGMTVLLLTNRPPALDDVPPEVVTAPAPNAEEPLLERDLLGTLAVVPTFDGHPMRLPPESRASLSFGDPSRSIGVPRAIDHDGFLLPVRAGTYALRLRLEVADEGSTPSTRECRSTRDVPDLQTVAIEPDHVTHVKIPVQCVVRLLQPRDTARSLPSRSVVLDSPVTFAWAAVPRAVRYTYKLTHGGFGDQRVVAEGDTDRTSWTAVLDPSLPKDGYRFTVVAQRRDGSKLATLSVTTTTAEFAGSAMSEWYDFRVAGGDPQPGTGRIEIVPTYDGAPLDRGLDVAVKVSLSREDEQRHREVEGRLVNGVIVLDRLATGIYHVNLRFDARTVGTSLGLSQPWLMTDSSPRLGLVTDGQTLRRELALVAPLELREPAAFARPIMSVENPSVASPITFAWSPVPGARGYEIEVVLFGGTEPPRKLTFARTETSWTAELPPTEPKNQYLVILSAKGKHDTIAKTLAHFAVTAAGSTDGERLAGGG